MVHLRMSGQLLLADPTAPRPAHTHVVMHLAPDSDGAADLLFVDPRTFGEVVVFDPDHAATEVPELARLGLDPLADPFTVADLWALVHRRRTRIKLLLLDQHLIAGIGNIYSDEILHRARIHPDRAADTLDPPGRAPPAPGDPRRARRGRASPRVDVGRRPVRRPDGWVGLVPARTSRVRPRRRALRHLRSRDHPTRGGRRAQLPLVPGVPTGVSPSFARCARSTRSSWWSGCAAPSCWRRRASSPDAAGEGATAPSRHPRRRTSRRSTGPTGSDFRASSTSASDVHRWHPRRRAGPRITSEAPCSSRR